MKKLLFSVLIFMCPSFGIMAIDTLFSAQKINFLTDPSKENIKAADFNGDGFLDIASISKINEEYTLAIITNDSMNFSDSEKTIISARKINYEVADINNDGLLDIVTAYTKSDGNSVLKVFAGDGNLNFHTLFTHPLFQTGELVIFDFDNEGKKDIYVGSGTEDNLFCTIFKNTNGNFSVLKTSIPVLSDSKTYVVDTDSNGRKDLLVTGIKDSVVTRLYINDAFAFQASPIKFEKNHHTIGTVADYNNDGHMDVVLCGTNINGVRKWKVILFPTVNMVVLDSIPAIEEGMVELIDFNHDGAHDIFIGGVNADKIGMGNLYLQYSGKFNFNEKINFPSYTSYGVGDLSMDGNPDIIGSSAAAILPPALYLNLSTPNTGPAPSSLLQGIYIDNKLFATWSEAMDDKTSAKNISYDIFIGTDATTQQIASCETNLENGRRLVSKLGSNFHSSVICFENANIHETNTLGVIAIDNAFISIEKDSTVKGLCTGVIGNILKQIERKTLTICKKTELLLETKSGKEGIWYTNNKGILGKSKNIKIKVEEDDVIYALETDMSVATGGFVLTIDVDDLADEKKFSNEVLCAGSTLNLEGKQMIKWIWHSGGNIDTSVAVNFSRVISDSGKLLIQSIPDSGCQFSDTIDVKVIDQPEISIIKKEQNGEVKLEAQNAQNFLWLLPDGSTSSVNPLTFPRPASNQQYSVTGNNEMCADTASILITVLNNFFVPQLFTPDGDGKNDRFKIYGENIAEINFLVTDRNGNTVYESDNVITITDQGWDGYINGEIAQNGVYFWKLKGRFLDGSPITEEGITKGTLKVVR